MKIPYKDYLDKVHGGWIGKSIGGTLGAEYEGVKTWIDLEVNDIIPQTLPPNDDLDLQILWLKVLEEKGPALRAEDLADAWIQGCWYPFSEYGNFRRNYRHGIRPPYTGAHDNDLFHTGMGCPIRSEIWGYALPGAPDIAAGFAWTDGTLDHTRESASAEQLFAAMAADAFFESDIRRLAEKHLHYLQPDTLIAKMVHLAFESYDQGLPLRKARERIMLLGGHPAQANAQINVPFTFLALLYGEADLEKTILAALRCGFDTDCTMATAGAFIGQILGARRIPKKLRDIVGDSLVMGIEYRRKEMTLSALARDTALVALKLAQALETGVDFAAAPPFAPYPDALLRGAPRLVVDYPGIPAGAPGDNVPVTLAVENIPHAKQPAELRIKAPKGWTAMPHRLPLDIRAGASLHIPILLQASPNAPRWASGHHFQAQLVQKGKTLFEESFGVAGAMLWRILAVFYDPCNMEGCHEPVTLETIKQKGKNFRQHFAAFDRNYIDETKVAKSIAARNALFEDISELLGKPAVLPCRDSFIDPETLIGLRGPCAYYLDATLVSPRERDAFFWIGSNDAWRLYCNGVMAGQHNIQRWHCPTLDRADVHLKKGPNRLLLKLLKRGENLRFSIGLREMLATPEFPRKNDWVTDIQWGNPLGSA